MRPLEEYRLSYSKIISYTSRLNPSKDRNLTRTLMLSHENKFSGIRTGIEVI